MRPFSRGETWESSRNSERVQGATVRVRLGGIFLTRSGQTTYEFSRKVVQYPPAGCIRLVYHMSLHLRWLTRFIAQGIAPQAGLGKWRIFELFLIFIDYRFCPDKNRQMHLFAVHLLSTPGGCF